MSKETATKQTNSGILLYDIETAPMKVYTWGLYPDSISHSNIIEDWSILCAGYKWLGDDKVHSLQVTTPGDDYELVKKLGEIITSAQVLVGHNSKKFDTKKLNARLIYHKLPPIPNIPQVDTLKEVKKIAAFSSNRLDYLGKMLIGEGKIHTEPNLWLDVMAGSKLRLKEMVKYCKGDVLLLEKIYLHLRPYMNTHPHVSMISDGGDKQDCPKCGSMKTQKRGTSITSTGNKQQRMQCQDCGGWHQVPYK